MSEKLSEIREKAIAEGIVKRYTVFSIGTGVLPFPIIDLVALVSVQVKMLEEISKVYGEDLVKDIGKAAITTLIASLAPTALFRGAMGSLIKGVPFIGGALGIVTFPIFCSASTYALGMVFVAHYESGGTFLTFNANDWKDQFTSLFKKKKSEMAKKEQKTGSEDSSYEEWKMGKKSTNEDLEDTIANLKKRIAELENKKA